jgi:hypothetical protein
LDEFTAGVREMGECDERIGGRVGQQLQRRLYHREEFFDIVWVGKNGKRP